MRRISEILNLAKPIAKPDIIEIGTSRSGSLPSFFEEEYVDTDKVKAKDLKKMLDSDGTIQALYNTIVMPILGSNWTIEPDNDSPKAQEQSAWVEETLRMPPHKDGMSTPFELVIAQALRAVVEGYAGFEKVFAIYEGKVVFKKIAWRDPTTVSMRSDERGGFNGMRQRAFIGNSYMDVIIPLERSFVYTYGKEFNNLKGRSAFLAAYNSYDKKRRLLYFSEQQAQSDAIKLKILKGKERASQDELDATVAAVDELGFKATVGIPEGYDLDTLNSGSTFDLLPLIEFHNAEMARSVLAMFILLGTGSKTGSYSLSQDQSDFFIQALMSIRKSLEQHITSYLIPDLYKYNYDKPEYGTFKFEDITDSTIDLLKTTFVKLTEKDRLPQSIIDGVVQKMADKLEIDVDMLEESINTPEPIVEAEPAMPAENALSLSIDGWRRQPTQAEKKVNFDGIQKKLNSLEAECERTIKPIYNQLITGALIKIDKYVQAGQYDKITSKNIFDENLKNQYIKVLKESGLDAYTYGKNDASDEIKVAIPTTPKESKAFFQDNAISVVEKQLSDLTFKIQAEVSKARRKDQLSKFSASDIISALNIMTGLYYQDTVGLTASVLVSIGINRGRKDVFDEYKDQVYAYQYSALLDNRTCKTCEALDGKVLAEAEYKNTIYDPPLHMGCRCIWVAIMADELEPPPITGFLTDDLVEPSLSNDLTEQIVELSKKAVNDEVKRLLAED